MLKNLFINQTGKAVLGVSCLQCSLMQECGSAQCFSYPYSTYDNMGKIDHNTVRHFYNTLYIVIFHFDNKVPLRLPSHQEIFCQPPAQVLYVTLWKVDARSVECDCKKKKKKSASV